jgi:hypothetical protein
MSNSDICKDGSKFWLNSKGQIHRDDGPAIIGAHGYQAWMQNGEWHREDGPARTWPDGTKEWYIHDKQIY